MSNEYFLSKYPWVSEFFNQCKAPIVVKDLYPIYMCICKELYHGNYDTVNVFFDMIDVTNLEDTVMCSLLHVTYNWRNETKSWAPLRDRCVVEIQRRGNSSYIIFRGLL